MIIPELIAQCKYRLVVVYVVSPEQNFFRIFYLWTIISLSVKSVMSNKHYSLLIKFNRGPQKNKKGKLILGGMSIFGNR